MKNLHVSSPGEERVQGFVLRLLFCLRGVETYFKYVCPGTRLAVIQSGPQCSFIINSMIVLGYREYNQDGRLQVCGFIYYTHWYLKAVTVLIK